MAGAFPEESWKPRAMPPLGVELTERQRLACLHRILARIGFNENMAGHVTMTADAAGNLWASPWGLWWGEVQASDLVLVSPAGEVLDGHWDVSPAIFVHTGIHRARPDARVVVHNHPYHATLLATLGRLPEITHQGQVLDTDAAEWLAERVGDADGVILVSHGAIVIGASTEEATYRSVTFDRMCRLTADALGAGEPTLEIAPEHRQSLKDAFRTHALDAYWNGAVRQLLRDQPDVLD
jgi:ribulose-5-phosphate 4-epimerase/fuculose-1-phosphate aldolase